MCIVCSMYFFPARYLVMLFSVHVHCYFIVIEHHSNIGYVNIQSELNFYRVMLFIFIFYIYLLLQNDFGNNG